MNTREFRKVLDNCSKKELIDLYHFRKWDGKGLLLIPHKYYKIIPNGYSLHTISGRNIEFKKGSTDNDSRYGLLSYGVKREPDRKPRVKEELPLKKQLKK